MPKCQWRDRPGDALSCNTLPDAGQELCPRHVFLAELKTQRRVAKESAQGRQGSQLPRTRAELAARGYHFKGQGNCRGCNQQIEWYDTPNGRNAPFNQMPLDTSPAVSHFGTCSRANQFRKVG